MKIALFFTFLLVLILASGIEAKNRKKNKQKDLINIQKQVNSCIEIIKTIFILIYIVLKQLTVPSNQTISQSVKQNFINGSKFS